MRIEFSESIGNDPQVWFRLYEPLDVPSAKSPLVLDCQESPPVTSLAQLSTNAPPPSSPLVKDVGLDIFSRLSQHPGVKAALERIAAANPDDYCPVYLEMTTEAAEVLPFETLFVPNRAFLALDERTPIVRVAAGTGSDTDVTERLFNLPLRITLVISASNRNMYEDAEWQALYKSLSNTQLPIEVQVLVGRDQLRSAIEQQCDQRFKVEIIKDDWDGDDLVRKISDFEPAILHFFCHGQTEPSVYLDVATCATHDMGEDPIFVSQNAIRSVVDSLWLITLNACEGAAPVKDAHSMALALVNLGVPAVVGMREAIDANDANVFSGSFYKALLAELHRVLVDKCAAGPSWPRLMRVPRNKINKKVGGPPNQAAEKCKAWTLPVLYVRPGEFRLRIPTQQPSSADKIEERRERFGELRTLLEVRERLHPETPAPLVADVEARIAHIEGMLFGTAHS